MGLRPGHGVSPVPRKTIAWTNADVLSIGLLGTNFSENLIVILSFSYKKMRWNCRSAKVVAIEIVIEILTILFNKMCFKCRLRNDGHFVQEEVNEIYFKSEYRTCSKILSHMSRDVVIFYATKGNS